MDGKPTPIEPVERPGDQDAAQTDAAFSFAPFRLFAAQRILLKGGTPVRLGSRALDILIHLVERAGAIVSKDELLEGVWPDTTVAEGSLRSHVGGLRRALGDHGRHYVVNIPGRGYCFVATVSSSGAPLPAGATAPALDGFSSLPYSPARMIGRAEIVDSLAEILPRRRFVTIVGPGGIGKTTVALAVTATLEARYPDGVAFIDLAPIADAKLVLSAIAATVGAAAITGDGADGLIEHLRDKRMLLVLDSLDHVLDSMAPLAEAVSVGAPGVHVLATSREPLRAAGEWIRRLPALAVAPPSTTSACEALAFPAVELFVERATANLDSFQLNDSNASIVVEICRKLEGIPLAIELAAGRVSAFGIAGLAAALDDRFALTARGRRTATPRHRTMSATLDWSYQRLAEPERVVLRRLSIFAGGFTLNAAQAVLSDMHPEPNLMEQLANLVDKSLLNADVGGANASYRLLDMTRAYGLERLRESNELNETARRHAEYCRTLFATTGTDLDACPPPERLDEYASAIDDLRAALDWAFSPAGDASLGVALTIDAAPLWCQFSSLGECRRRVEQALAHLPGSDEATRQRLQLLSARGLPSRTRLEPSGE